MVVNYLSMSSVNFAIPDFCSLIPVGSLRQSRRVRNPFSKIRRSKTSNWGTERGLVRVATFNINNINKRLDNLLAWLAKTQPDVVSLQELKAEQQALPVNALRTLGYEAVWQGESSWNGVAILARTHVPVLTCTSLPGAPCLGAFARHGCRLRGYVRGPRPCTRH